MSRPQRPSQAPTRSASPITPPELAPERKPDLDNWTEPQRPSPAAFLASIGDLRDHITDASDAIDELLLAGTELTGPEGARNGTRGEYRKLVIAQGLKAIRALASMRTQLDHLGASR